MYEYMYVCLYVCMSGWAGLHPPRHPRRHTWVDLDEHGSEASCRFSDSDFVNSPKDAAAAWEAIHAAMDPVPDTDSCVQAAVEVRTAVNSSLLQGS